MQESGTKITFLNASAFDNMQMFVHSHSEKSMDSKTIASLIFDAFVEGYNAYSTPSNAYNTVEGAWEESTAREIALHHCPAFVPNFG